MPVLTQGIPVTVVTCNHNTNYARQCVAAVTFNCNTNTHVTDGSLQSQRVPMFTQEYIAITVAACTHNTFKTTVCIYLLPGVQVVQSVMFISWVMLEKVPGGHC